MALLWTDSRAIAIALDEKYPDHDILAMRFTDLWKMVQDLEDFQDHPEGSNEKILEAIQMAWLDEQS